MQLMTDNNRGKSPTKPPELRSWSKEMELEHPIDGDKSSRGEAKPTSWAQKLGSNLPSHWSKNVLEVVLQKEGRGAFVVSDEECARLMRKLGLDPRPGLQVEAVQICPNGRGNILITLKKEVPIERFCRYDVIEVTSSGIRAVLVKPAGKREIIVTARGIHPNTRDDTVTEYISKFGRLVSTKVVHGVYREGPLQGLKNGDRSFKVEFKPSENMGTYHVIDGHKVTVRYPGQQQTCARCHETPQQCPGKGMAKKCEAAGGPKIDLADHLLELWAKIGYSPKVNTLCDDVTLDDEEVVQQGLHGESFTPAKGYSDPSLFKGVCIKTFPKDTDQGVIMEFLIKSGLDEKHMDDVTFNSNGSVSIKNMISSECTALISTIHNNEQFGRRLFCNGFIPLTPEKQDIPVRVHPTGTSSPLTTGSSSPPSSSSAAWALSSTATCLSADSPATIVTTNMTGSPITSILFPPEPAPSKTSPTPTSTGLSTSSPDQSFLGHGAASVITELDHNLDLLSENDLARRHSLSMRDIPPGSLADEIMNLGVRRKSILGDIKDISRKFSDFESCHSALSSLGSDSDSSTTEHSDLKIFQTMNNKKRGFKKKRKASLTPRKDEFLKKPNESNSPLN